MVDAIFDFFVNLDSIYESIGKGARIDCGVSAEITFTFFSR